MLKVKFKLLTPDAQVPSISKGNVGYDIRSSVPITLRPLSPTLVPTGIAIADDIIHNCQHVPFFKIEGRSGLASKGVFPIGGIIDPSYRGEIKAILYNSNSTPVSFEIGDRIAQLVCYVTMSPPIISDNIEFSVVDSINQTDRGSNGFGSSGTK